MWQPRLDPSAMRYMAIADAIHRDVRAGMLAPGDALPTHRELAERLGVTVGTVTRGYAEAARRGLVRGETGRGTFVAGRPGQPGREWVEVGGSGIIEMGMNLPLEAFSPALGPTLARLAGNADLEQLLRYQTPEGLLRHREAGAAWVARHGLAVSPEHVLVCSGAQHAMLVALAGVFRPGDRVGVECLTYPPLKTIARQFQLRLVPLPMDERGLDTDALERLLGHTELRGLYVQPGCHNPTTATLCESRRQHLCDLAQRHRLRIVEDDAYGLTVDHGLPPLAARLPEQTAFIVSTSKMLCGGLRVGYLASPRRWLPWFRRGLMASTWMTAPLMAEIASEWIFGSTAERVLEAKRAEARARNTLAREVLAGLTLHARPGGHFLWLELPEPWRGMELVQAALDQDVAVAAAESFAVGQGGAAQAVRLSLSGPRDADELRRGLGVLTELLSGSAPGEAIL
ncbi:MAG: PLP-dependent aminotransferase family protein [Desulfovibrionaceae bacterium]